MVQYPDDPDPQADLKVLLKVLIPVIIVLVAIWLVGRWVP